VSDNQDSQHSDKHRPIRSFVIRSGRLTDSQRKAIDAHWQDFVIDYKAERLDFDSLFARSAPLTVEIGFGMGDSLLAMAADAPEQNFLGIEVHKPGVGKLLHGINQRGLSNLRVICDDATQVIAHCLAKGSVQRFLIFFPDPWHKKRHNKRRLVQAAFVEELSELLVAGGQIHLATDWEPYAEHMLEVMEADSTLINSNGTGQFWESPNRPETKFERRGQRLGHGVWDLLYHKPTDTDPE